MLISLLGGLGNQMFIYSFAKALSLKGYPILLDGTRYKDRLHKDSIKNNMVSTNRGGGKLRLLEIMLYNISIPICFDYKTLTCYLLDNDKSLKYKYIGGYINCIIKKEYDETFHHIKELYQYRIIEDPFGNNILKMFLDNSLPIHSYPFGYFQNLIYFKEIDSILRQEFSLKIPLKPRNEALKKKIASLPNSVFLHVRLGDYVSSAITFGSYVVLSKTYYQQAVNIIKQRLKQPHIFIFSNDIKWCEDNLRNFIDFSDCDVWFVNENDEGYAAEEMELMKTCRHAIIANSTFSYFAAYLIDNSDKIVITPNHFFNDTRKIPNFSMLVQKGWIMIDPFWGTYTIA